MSGVDAVADEEREKSYSVVRTPFSLYLEIESWPPRLTWSFRNSLFSDVELLPSVSPSQDCPQSRLLDVLEIECRPHHTKGRGFSEKHVRRTFYFAFAFA